jgi:hypothetical protein
MLEPTSMHKNINIMVIIHVKVFLCEKTLGDKKCERNKAIP